MMKIIKREELSPGELELLMDQLKLKEEIKRAKIEAMVKKIPEGVSGRQSNETNTGSFKKKLERIYEVANNIKRS